MKVYILTKEHEFYVTTIEGVFADLLNAVEAADKLQKVEDGKGTGYYFNVNSYFVEG